MISPPAHLHLKPQGHLSSTAPSSSFSAGGDRASPPALMSLGCSLLPSVPGPTLLSAATVRGRASTPTLMILGMHQEARGAAVPCPCHPTPRGLLIHLPFLPLHCCAENQMQSIEASALPPSHNPDLLLLTIISRIFFNRV